MVGQRFANYDGRLEAQSSLPEIGRQYPQVTFKLHKKMNGNYVLRAEMSIPHTEFSKFYLILNLNKDNDEITEDIPYDVVIFSQYPEREGGVPTFGCKLIKRDAK